MLGGFRLHQLDSAGERLPSVRAYRAFTSVGWESITGSVAGEQPDRPFSGPDGAGRTVVAQLIRSAGVRSVRGLHEPRVFHLAGQPLRLSPLTGMLQGSESDHNAEKVLNDASSA